MDKLSAGGKKNRTTCATNGDAKCFYVLQNIHFDSVRCAGSISVWRKTEEGRSKSKFNTLTPFPRCILKMFKHLIDLVNYIHIYSTHYNYNQVWFIFKTLSKRQTIQPYKDLLWK